jgi:hypothetical protein
MNKYTLEMARRDTVDICKELLLPKFKYIVICEDKYSDLLSPEHWGGFKRDSSYPMFKYDSTEKKDINFLLTFLNSCGPLVVHRYRDNNLDDVIEIRIIDLEK